VYPENTLKTEESLLLLFVKECVFISPKQNWEGMNIKERTNSCSDQKSRERRRRGEGGGGSAFVKLEGGGGESEEEGECRVGDM